MRADMAIQRWLRRWLHQEDGVSTVLLGLLIIPLIGFIGLSVDGAYLYMVHSRLSYATDAAALAGGKILLGDKDDAETETKNNIQAYLNANFPNGMFGATLLPPDVTTSDDRSSIKVDTVAIVPTLFMQIFGIRTVRLTASSTVEPQGGLEVVLVLDVTGSMCMPSCAKLNAMQSGAKALLDTVFQDAAPDAVYAAIVPFRASVNIGNNHKDWIQSSYNWSQFPKSDPWKGCVEARDITKTGDDGLSLDLSSQPPTEEQYKFKPYLYPNTAEMGPDHDGTYKYKHTTTTYDRKHNRYVTTTETVAIKFDNNWPKKNGVYAPSGVYGSNLGAVGPNLGCPAQPIIPLTNDKQKLEDAIDSFVAVSRGVTQVS
jgi:Flp pilus assembly protein TadG